MNTLERYITSYFKVMENDLDIIASLFKETKLSKNDFFVRKEHFCNKLSFLHEGYIRVFSNRADKEITQWIGSKGYFMTDLSSFIFKNRSRWNIQALTDCTLYTIEGNDYETLKRTIPDWDEIEKRFIAGCFLMLEDRVFSHLSLTAEERYDTLFNQNKELFNHVPLQYIASMLGMSPETLSRIRNKKKS